MSPATFRGVPFHLESSERAGGRRTVLHEYPLRDDPFSEDMGRKARSFPCEGYVIGDDYRKQRDALLEALEKEGPGELVHPEHGTRRVIVTSYRVRDMRDEGRVSRFSIEFAETPAEPKQPSAVPDVAAAVQTSASAASDSCAVEFLAKYNPNVLVAGLSDAVRRATLVIDTVLATGTMTTQALASLRTRVDALTSSLTSLVTSPEDLLASLLDIFEDLGTDQSDGAPSPVAAVLKVYDFDPGVRPPATTSTREQEQTNFDAIQLLIQRLTVIQAANLAVLQTFDSYEEAVIVRDSIVDLLDEQADAANDDTYPALLQLRADLVAAVPGPDSELAHLVTYTPAGTVPSLVLAHRLYGHLDLEADLLARNHVANPGFVSGDLEVLSDG